MRVDYLGPVISPPPGFTHAGVPTPAVITDSLVRVFFSARDDRGVARPFSIDGQVDTGGILWQNLQGPLLDTGGPGTFDHDGLLCCSVVQDDQSLLMYYAGFEHLISVPYRLTIGVATADAGDIQFQRPRGTPIIDRSPGLESTIGGPFVRRLRGDAFEMYFSAGRQWISRGQEKVPSYGIRYATSCDGYSFIIHEPTVLHPNDEFYALGRSWVHSWMGQEFLLFSRRSRQSGVYEQAYAPIVGPGKVGQPVKGLPGSGEDLELPQDGFFAASFVLDQKLWFLFNVGDLGRDGIHVLEVIGER